MIVVNCLDERLAHTFQQTLLAIDSFSFLVFTHIASLPNQSVLTTMDPLTIVTAAAKLAQIFILSTYTIYQTAKAIKEAPKQALALRNEISSVLGVLLLLE